MNLTSLLFNFFEDIGLNMGNSGFLKEVVEVNWLLNVTSAHLRTGSPSANTLQSLFVKITSSSSSG
ncbi:unnamed protein product [Brassica oleracea var. botrytis]